MTFILEWYTSNNAVHFPSTADLMDLYYRNFGTWPHDPFQYIFTTVFFEIRGVNLNQIIYCLQNFALVCPKEQSQGTQNVFFHQDTTVLLNQKIWEWTNDEGLSGRLQPIWSFILLIHTCWDGFQVRNTVLIFVGYISDFRRDMFFLEFCFVLFLFGWFK